ncbi:putative quinol monooxygenase [Chitinophaga barathri]|uniref:Antibiotic biosynthesis monooxygenase n=1 Tax=Chitinophaga barathri TaxID=1647451 RepID=A0A3N4MHG5_9BACT|nr:antibiotic biosynthesis monooxygenase [Chitinophaga barathri]RPD41486.1 antibiotic biosynthesis monooxygenase [Chitinophaga barathri]
MNIPKALVRPTLFFGAALALIACHTNPGTQTPQKVRLAKVVIDSTQLESYKKILKEEIEASVQKEPGVLTLYAVFEKERPSHLTILEIYASEEAYQSHIKTPHFLKYKNGTAAMVKALELIDADPLIPGLKIK